MPSINSHADRIKEGDQVFLITLESRLQPGTYNEVSEAVTVLWISSGPGDLWQFQRPDGSIFAINPYSPSFVRIEKKKKGNR